jgi:hypothetical protein
VSAELWSTPVAILPVMPSYCVPVQVLSGLSVE